MDIMHSKCFRLGFQIILNILGYDKCESDSWKALESREEFLVEQLVQEWSYYRTYLLYAALLHTSEPPW